MKVEEITSILCELHKISGFRVSLHGTDFKEIAAYPAERLPFCAEIQKNKNEFKRCELCDKEAATVVLESGKAHIYKCRYGLCEAVCPLYNFGTLTGYLMMGQVADESTDLDALRSALFNLSHDFSRINEIVDKTPEVRSERIGSFVNIMTICAEYMTLANILTSSAPRLPELAKIYLHENYSEKVTIEKMCRTFCCSKSTLLTAFKKEYGRTVISYLSELRVEEAKKLLDSTALSISEISDATGFYDQSYFSKVFLKEVGITPSDYRKEIRR